MSDVAAISIQAELKSISGSSHIYPPTFAGIGHNLVGYDKASGTFHAVQVDSPGSFANRIEAELASLDLLPDITSQIGARTLSVHELPHRIYDAILRDSLLDTTPWRQSEVGRVLLSSNAQNATALFTYAPLTLLLGGWDSHGGDAGNGTKLARAVACEIWGYNGRVAKHCTQRIDPLKITSNAENHSIIDGVLTPDVNGKRPSELGHGDVPDQADKGVFVERVELRGAISLTRLSRYRFPDANGKTTPQRDQAARNVLIELAKLGISLVLERLDLRSGCELYTTSRIFELVHSDGSRQPLSINSSKDSLLSALDIAGSFDLRFNVSPLRLTAGPALTALVARGGDL